MKRHALLALSLLLGSGCAAGLATSAVAVGAAIHQRAHGRCVAACTAGNVCNPSSGFCDAVPCAAGCPAGASCVATAVGAHCQLPASTTLASPHQAPGS